MADEPPKIPEQEIMRRQAIIDAYWGAQRDAEDYKRRQAQARSCHRGPSDSDWDLVNWPW
jgi:hypothetical protein